MSGKGIIRTFKKKVNIISETSLKKKIINNNKLINVNKSLYRNEDDDNFLCQLSNELLNENIKLPGKVPPFINPVPCFTVKNDNSKKTISKRGTYYKNMKIESNILQNKENNTDNSNDIIYVDKDNTQREKTKINYKKFKKNHINNRYSRPHSPDYELKDNKILKSENININKTNNHNEINYELFINNKKKLIKTFNRNILANSKPDLSCTKKKKMKKRNHLHYSTDNFLNIPYIKEDKNTKELEEIKLKKRYVKQLGQKINVAMMKIEILQNYKKNKSLNSIRKKIEYNKVYCNNDLQRLKDNYNNNINQHFNQIKYLKMRLIKCQDKFLTINKHKDIINKEELLFKIKKMDIIEKIILLQKRLNDFVNPDSTANDTNSLDESFEERTIKDMSFNDYSIIKETIGVNYSYNFNKAYFNENNMYENKIIKVKPNEINMFTAKFINNMKDKKMKNKIDN